MIQINAFPLGGLALKPRPDLLHVRWRSPTLDPFMQPRLQVVTVDHGDAVAVDEGASSDSPSPLHSTTAPSTGSACGRTKPLRFATLRSRDFTAEAIRASESAGVHRSRRHFVSKT